jgi:hypothetical protein
MKGTKGRNLVSALLLYYYSFTIIDNTIIIIINILSHISFPPIVTLSQMCTLKLSQVSYCSIAMSLAQLLFQRIY